MTGLPERALDRARALLGDLQDEVARMILSFAGDGGQIVPLTPEERAAVEGALEAAARGECATDADDQAVWAKHGLRGPETRVLRSPTSNGSSTTSPFDRRRAPAVSLASYTPQKGGPSNFPRRPARLTYRRSAGSGSRASFT